MNTPDLLTWGLRLAGLGQLFVAAITFWLRRIVDWNADLAKLRPLNRCIVHTYGFYIQAINAVFGLICLLQPRELLAKTPLAADVTLLIAVYWLVRLTLGFIYYDTHEITTQRALYRLGEYFFECLFAAQVVALLAAFAYNVGWIID